MGAEIHLGARARVDYEFTPLADRDCVQLGAVRLEILETPGHSPESISILVFDPAVDDDRPLAVLTGDTLFIGDVGRPDLRASLGWSAEELGGLLYESVHAAAAAASRRDPRVPGTRRGLAVRQASEHRHRLDDRRSAPLQLRAPADEPRRVRPRRHGRPARYAGVLRLRRGAQREGASDPDGVARRGPEAAVARRRCSSSRGTGRSSWTLARPPTSRARISPAASTSGSTGAMPRGRAPLLEHDRPIVIVVEPGREQEAAVRLGRIGFDNVAGYLEGGMQALASRPELVARIEPDHAGDARRAAGRARAAARDRRSGRERARRGADRRQREHPTDAAAGAARTSYRAAGRSSCTARPATARRSRRASCSSRDSIRSSISSAESGSARCSRSRADAREGTQPEQRVPVAGGSGDAEHALEVVECQLRPAGAGREVEVELPAREAELVARRAPGVEPARRALVPARRGGRRRGASRSPAPLPGTGCPPRSRRARQVVRSSTAT